MIKNVSPDDSRKVCSFKLPHPELGNVELCVKPRLTSPDRFISEVRNSEQEVLGSDIFDLFSEKKQMFEYDVLVNCVMWDTSRTDRVIYRSDLKIMKPGTLIIDVACDPYLEIETSRPTTISDPVYEIDGVIHYAVDNTPAMYPITVTKVLSEGLIKYINVLIENEYDDYPENIKAATVIKDGCIRDNRIIEFRKARNVFVNL